MKLPRPDEVRALAATFEHMLADAEEEIRNSSSDGSQAGHQELWRRYLSKIEALLDAIEQCAGAIERDDPGAPVQLERLEADVRAFERPGSAVRGSRIRPVVSLPWARAGEPPRPAGRVRPRLRLVRDEK